MRRNPDTRDKIDVSDIVKGEGLGEWTDEVNFDQSSADLQRSKHSSNNRNKVSLLGTNAVFGKSLVHKRNTIYQ